MRENLMVSFLSKK